MVTSWSQSQWRSYLRCSTTCDSGDVSIGIFCNVTVSGVVGATSRALATHIPRTNLSAKAALACTPLCVAPSALALSSEASAKRFKILFCTCSGTRLPLNTFRIFFLTLFRRVLVKDTVNNLNEDSSVSHCWQDGHRGQPQGLWIFLSC